MVPSLPSVVVKVNPVVVEVEIGFLKFVMLKLIAFSAVISLGMAFEIVRISFEKVAVIVDCCKLLIAVTTNPVSIIDTMSEETIAFGFHFGKVTFIFPQQAPCSKLSSKRLESWLFPPPDWSETKLKRRLTQLSPSRKYC
jgi:hypothetical protein